MPNGVVITRSMGDCPRDAAQVDANGKVLRAPLAEIQSKPAARPAVVTAPAPAQVDARGRLPVSADKWAGQWPLALRSGALECVPMVGGKTQAALFHGSDGLTYALNGIANGHGPGGGWHPISAIWLPNPQIPGTRIPTSGLIAQALALCAR